MEKRKLAGKSQLHVTPVILGTWAMGGAPFWKAHDEAVSITAIQTALDLGVNCIDTAPVYGFGYSEELVAKAIGGRRDNVILATKCGLRWRDTTSAGSLYNDLSASSIQEEVENSLRRLNTDRIDLYQIHWPDPATPIADTMQVLEKLREQGKIVDIGVSNYDTAMLDEALKSANVVSVQPKYNLLERDIESSLLPFCAERSIGVIAYSPLASGILTGKYAKDQSFDDWRGKKNFGVFQEAKWESAMAKTEKLKEIAEDYGFTMSQLAIRWVIEQKGVTSAIVGCNSPEQVEENILAVELRIDKSFIPAIESAIA